MHLFKNIVFYLICGGCCCPVYGQFVSDKKSEDVDTSYYYVVLKNKTTLLGKKGSLSSEYLAFEDIFLGKMQVNTKNIEDIEKVTQEHLFSIQTKNNTSFVTGHIVNINKSSIQMEVLHMGIVEVPFQKIQSIAITQQESSKYRFTNPHPTRYAVTHSAIPLKKKEAYFQNFLVLFNGFQYGVTDNFSIGGGSFVPFVLFMNPRFGFRVADNVYLGGGAFLGTSTIFHAFFGVIYGTATYGNKENNISVNVGWGGTNMFSNAGSWEWLDSPIITISAMKRLSTRFAIVTEHAFFNDSDRLRYRTFSLGGRAIWVRHSLELSGIIPFVGNSILLPCVGYVFKF
ncbi:MAG: hypothetical protein QM536_09170 [Chitinophagaceae bacterium]|nr:hypothetical protein [Chitinophagaceae bacterium]